MQTISSPAAATSRWILLSNDGVRSSKILIRDESFGLTTVCPRGTDKLQLCSGA